MTKVNLSRQSRNNVVIATVAHVGACFLVLLTSLFSTAHASPSSDLEKQFSDIFVKRSFTLRNFYRGGRLSVRHHRTTIERGRTGLLVAGWNGSDFQG